MAVWALGINHTTAPLDLRGRFAFAIDQIEPTLRGLRESLSGREDRSPEAAILSTCNRTEIYAVAADPEKAEALLKAWWCAEKRTSVETIEAYGYFYAHEDVIRHLHRVAAGVDSLNVAAAAAVACWVLGRRS